MVTMNSEQCLTQILIHGLIHGRLLYDLELNIILSIGVLIFRLFYISYQLVDFPHPLFSINKGKLTLVKTCTGFSSFQTGCIFFNV